MVHLLNECGFFEKFVFVVEDLFIVAVLLPVTADVADSPKLLTELLRVELKLALFLATTVLVDVEAESFQAETAGVQFVLILSGDQSLPVLKNFLWHLYDLVFFEQLLAIDLDF